MPPHLENLQTDQSKTKNDADVIKILVEFFSWVVCFIFMYPEQYFEYGSGESEWIRYRTVPTGSANLVVGTSP
jgi:hypothetical protein